MNLKLVRAGGVGSAVLLLSLSAGAVSPASADPGQRATPHGACRPSTSVLKADAVKVAGLSRKQSQNATDIINAARASKVPARGQTIAVMTALQASALKNADAPAATDTTAEAAPMGVFGQGLLDAPTSARMSPTNAAKAFYGRLTAIPHWEDLTPTLAAHAVQHNLDPQAYARYWPRANRIVDTLTAGTGAAGLTNLAARAQSVADCAAATVQGRFAITPQTEFVGPLSPADLITRAQAMSADAGVNWYRRCQAYVAVLDGRPYSGYATALDAWETFVAAGVAHPVTAADGISPPPGAWLYYASATSAAGHVVTYLGGGQITSTDVFGTGRVGIGPASSITDGPWHLQYLGWAPPWGG